MKTSLHFQTIAVASAVALFTSFGPAAAQAQSNAADTALTEFPTDSRALTAKEINERLRGNIFNGTTATGSTFRVEYQASGYVFLNLANGARDSGTWLAEEGRVCVHYRGRLPSGCTELRATPDAVYGKREGANEVTVMRMP